LNLEQLDHFASMARYVPDYGRAILQLIAARRGERVLDLGCGDGTLARTLVSEGVVVIGVDNDQSMVELARRHCSAAIQCDIRRMSFAGEFDAIYSNSALHLVGEAENVAARIAMALKSKGRFAAELGARGNIAAIVTALLAVLERFGIDGTARIPWYFPSSEEYCDILERAGFVISSVETQYRPTPMPSGIDRWIEMLAVWFLEALPCEQREAAKQEVTWLLEPTLRSSDGRWIADYVRLRVCAHLP
jgi:trans-aconitate methyltransferase